METTITKEMLDSLTRRLVGHGKIIEAGWVGLRHMAIPENASDTQISEMRKAFFAGAQHLYGSIMSMLEPGDVPTDADMDLMRFIDAELRNFVSRA